MITIHLVAADGTTTTLEGKPGFSLMETAVHANAPGIEADCGGLLTCATCHVIVREPFASQLPKAADDEIAMLDFTATPARPGSRLSCQIHLTEALDGLTVDLPASQH
ncbi:MAG: 2Fe-2S iron-sulfur cluster binding domain-containing protein [Burkholderiales bacterium]|jgi:2Fe-2S ferredoxin|nr:2Fe-2S iron-sulfur cluster binding domain-containing protein [Burkholderiales bacterium]